MTKKETRNSGMHDLFRSEVESHCARISAIIDALTDTADSETIKTLIKAIQSAKGAANLVKNEPALSLTAAMEKFLDTVQKNKISFDQDKAGSIKECIILLISIASTDEDKLDAWTKTNKKKFDSALAALAQENITEQNPESIKDTVNSDKPVPTIPLPAIQPTNAVDDSMLGLFTIEVETQAASLSENLLELEKNPGDPALLEALMRAAHSIKGAARMVGVNSCVAISHIMEDGFVAAQNGKITLTPDHMDIMLKGLDTIKLISELPADEQTSWSEANIDMLESLVAEIGSILSTDATPASSQVAPATTETKREPQGNSAINIEPTTSVDASMLDLFRIEVETHSKALTEALLELETNPTDSGKLESLMRAAHSIKGAARMVGVNTSVGLAHVMEDGFVAAQNGKITLNTDHIDTMLQGVDLLKQISELPAEQHVSWAEENLDRVCALAQTIHNIIEGTFDSGSAEKAKSSEKPRPVESKQTTPVPPPPAGKKGAPDTKTSDSFVRISAKRINSLIGLSGEFMVASGWVNKFSNSLFALKKTQSELINMIEKLRAELESSELGDFGNTLLLDTQSKADSCRQILAKRMVEIEEFDHRAGVLAGRLNHQVISSRMRPFGEDVQRFQRMVRDVARSLDKKIELEITGHDTQVDRDILEKIEAPLNHILRNSVDHGIEMPADRLAADKPERGTIKLEAFHSAGMLSIVISDDGRGVDLNKLREKIINKGMVSKAMAKDLSEAELLDFLFLPGFSTKENVTEISGRGVGLDVVHSMVTEMRGQIRCTTELGKGLRFQLQLPLTLSIMRSLLVAISGEFYAFPLARISSILKLKKEDIEILEDRQYFTENGQHIGLVDGAQVLGYSSKTTSEEILSVIVIGDRTHRYGVVVDNFQGERDFAIHTLDPRLGKIKDIAAGAITDDGTPTLIIDVDDILQSIENLISDNHLNKFKGAAKDTGASKYKRVLVVDDSLTVREVERKLLESRGYEVELAVDGMDGWNTVRTGEYDLVISDIDMPRMNGIEFVSLIKSDPDLSSIPVMIVSYKDRQEDRNKGLDAGADYYLAKGSFHDESLIEAVEDLIGEAQK